MRRSTCIGTANIATFQVKMDIDAGAVSPAIEAYAITSPNRNTVVLTKIKRWVASNSTTGIKEIADIPKEGRIPHLFVFKNDITSCELSVNGTKLWEPDKTLGEKIQRDYERQPDGTKYTAVDFMLEGTPENALVVQGVSDFRLRPNFGSAGSADVVVFYHSGLGGI